MTTTETKYRDLLPVIVETTDADLQYANLKYADLYYSIVQDDIPTTSPTSV